MLKRIALLFALLPACVLAAGPSATFMHDRGVAGDWGYSGAHFSRLSQITPRNVGHVGVAWIYDTGLRDRAFEDTPLVVDGRMYILLPNEVVVALDPDSGRKLWTYNPHEQRTRVSRGIAYWPGTRRIPPRLVVATADGHVIELDPLTGTPIPGFATRGVLNLRAVLAGGFPYAPFGFTSPPAVYRNLLILGPSGQEGPSSGPPGIITGINAVTGRIVWEFHTTPQPGQPGNATWGPGGWKGRAGPDAWGDITVDRKLGLAFVPVANPTDSYYGANRPGADLYSDSVVALDAKTGRLRWYYQFVHHDLQDNDTVSTSLVEAWKNGREIPAVAALTKSALLFVLDRRTGKPVFGVYNQPVARSDVPGEHSWPTQPYPLEPPPLARQSITRADLSTVTPASEAYCRNLFKKFPNEGPYTPFQLQPTSHFPSTVGGANWGGASYDPELGYAFVNTSDMGSIGQMVKAGSRTGRTHAFKPSGPYAKFLAHIKPMAYQNAYVGVRFVDQNGFPCQQPPWGLLTAVNMHTGRITWQVRLGDYPGLARAGVPPTGTPNLGGSLVTKSGLVFIGATMDGDFRAFDARTGQILWEAGLNGYGEATPMTYMGRDGIQYVAIAVGGPGLLQGVHHSVANPTLRIIAFALGGKSAAPTGGSVGEIFSTPSFNSTMQALTAQLPAGPGRQIVKQDCSLCHGVGNITQSHFSRAGWQTTLHTMMNRGAPVTPSQYKALLDYLVKNFGKSDPK